MPRRRMRGIGGRPSRGLVRRACDSKGTAARRRRGSRNRCGLSGPGGPADRRPASGPSSARAVRCGGPGRRRWLHRVPRSGGRAVGAACARPGSSRGRETSASAGNGPSPRSLQKPSSSSPGRTSYWRASGAHPDTTVGWLKPSPKPKCSRRRLRGAAALASAASSARPVPAVPSAVTSSASSGCKASSGLGGVDQPQHDYNVHAPRAIRSSRAGSTPWRRGRSQWSGWLPRTSPSKPARASMPSANPAGSRSRRSRSPAGRAALPS